MNPEPGQKPYHQLVDRKLLIRQGIFVIIAVLLLVSCAYDVYQGDLMWWLGIIGIAIGIIIGFVLGRFRAIRWHETKEKVVSQLDVVGIAAIVLYIIFDASRDWIFGHFLSGAALTAFTLAILSGLLIGRFFAVQASIKRVLKERGLSQ